jgi:hypothetical protein
MAGVRERDGGYQGCWECRDCRKTGESAATYANRKAALAWAQMVAATHCERHHPEAKE